MAHKKGLGSSKNGRDSNPKYLGVKMFDGQAREARQDHRPPARHEVPPGPRHGDRPRRHDLRGPRRARSRSARAASAASSSVVEAVRVADRCSATAPGFTSRPATAATAA